MHTAPSTWHKKGGDWSLLLLFLSSCCYCVLAVVINHLSTSSWKACPWNLHLSLSTHNTDQQIHSSLTWLESRIFVFWNMGFLPSTFTEWFIWLNPHPLDHRVITKWIRKDCFLKVLTLMKETKSLKELLYRYLPWEIRKFHAGLHQFAWPRSHSKWCNAVRSQAWELLFEMIIKKYQIMKHSVSSFSLASSWELQDPFVL